MTSLKKMLSDFPELWGVRQDWTTGEIQVIVLRLSAADIILNTRVPDCDRKFWVSVSWPGMYVLKQIVVPRGLSPGATLYNHLPPGGKLKAFFFEDHPDYGVPHLRICDERICILRSRQNHDDLRRICAEIARAESEKSFQ